MGKEYYIDKQSLFIERLERKGVKPTAMRLLILRTMMEINAPVSLLDLEKKLITVDKSTLFRTVTLFLAHHILHGFEDGSGSLKYEVCSNECACSIDDMHTHFFCIICHQTFCMKTTQIPEVSLPEGFSMHSINYVIKGVCMECNRKKRLSSY